jgi:hypothetical protein
VQTFFHSNVHQVPKIESQEVCNFLKHRPSFFEGHP